MAILVLHTGLLTFYSSGEALHVGYDATQGITKQIKALEVTVSEASGQNITGALLPMRGTWTLEVIN